MEDRKPIRLLVVEDDPAYLYLIQKAFGARQEQTKWDLSIASDGAEALQVLMEEEQDDVPLPDLILLDWNLPKVSGGEVLKRMKQDRHLCKIPILVFSSSKSDADVTDAYADHANGFITKPGDTDLLAEIVETIEQFWISVVTLPKMFRMKTNS